MNTYDELKARLIRAGFRDISRNYSGGGCTLLRMGYGQAGNPWPRFQLRVTRTQEGGFGSPVYFADWLETSEAGLVRISGPEDVWTAAVQLVDKATAGADSLTRGVLRECLAAQE